ncbi:hypothetical protein TURU_084370 [Turdus rufiventris]|nr:hypothetical protein TURU_084370 [Turdus rufiventris]
MDGPGAAAGAGPSNVPAFLTKLWTLVEDPDTDALICWSPRWGFLERFRLGIFLRIFPWNSGLESLGKILEFLAGILSEILEFLAGILSENPGILG